MIIISICFIRNYLVFQLKFYIRITLCTKFFFMCNIIVPLRPKTIKKDLFKIASCIPNCYVASISLGANMMQAIKVFNEAEAHNGPAIIIAYSPCIEHGIKTEGVLPGPLKVARRAPSLYRLLHNINETR